MGPWNISHLSVTSLPDLNSMTPSTSPFFRRVSKVRAQRVSFASFSRIHPCRQSSLTDGKTCLMVCSAIKFRFPQFDGFLGNFSINGVGIIRSNDLCRIRRRGISRGNRPFIKHVDGSISVLSPQVSTGTLLVAVIRDELEGKGSPKGPGTCDND